MWWSRGILGGSTHDGHHGVDGGLEVRELSDNGMVFTTILIMEGLGTFAYSFRPRVLVVNTEHVQRARETGSRKIEWTRDCLRSGSRRRNGGAGVGRPPQRWSLWKAMPRRQSVSPRGPARDSETPPETRIWPMRASRARSRSSHAARRCPKPLCGPRGPRDGPGHHHQPGLHVQPVTAARGWRQQRHHA